MQQSVMRNQLLSTISVDTDQYEPSDPPTTLYEFFRLILISFLYSVYNLPTVAEDMDQKTRAKANTKHCLKGITFHIKRLKLIQSKNATVFACFGQILTAASESGWITVVNMIVIFLHVPRVT